MARQTPTGFESMKIGAFIHAAIIQSFFFGPLPGSRVAPKDTGQFLDQMLLGRALRRMLSNQPCKPWCGIRLSTV